MLNKFGFGVTISGTDRATRIFNKVGKSFDTLTRVIVKGAQKQAAALRKAGISFKKITDQMSKGEKQRKATLKNFTQIRKSFGSLTKKIVGDSKRQKKAMQGVKKSYTSLTKSIAAGTKRIQKSSRFKKFRKNLRSLRREMRSVRQEASLGGVLIGGSMMLASKGVLGGIGSVINAAGKFEQGMASVKGVTKATAGEMDTLREAAIQAGIKTQFSPDEAREGLQSLATAGQTVTESTKTLIPVLDLAAGSLGQLGVGEAAAAVTGTLKSYGKDVGEAGIVTDKLLKITQLSNMQTLDFSAGLSKAASAGGKFGQTLDDTLITMGLLRNANIDASSASTAFREATRRAASHSGAQQAIEAKGVDIFNKKTKKMRSILDIITDLSKKTKDLDDREKKRLINQAFGARGLLAFGAVSEAMFTTMKNGEEVVLRGADAIEAMRKKMGDAKGTAKEFREVLLDTYEGQKTLLRGTLQTFAVIFGEPLIKILKPIVKGTVNTLNTLLVFFKDLPEPVKKGIMMFVSFAGALTGIIGSAMLLNGILGTLGFSFKGLILTLGQLLVVGPAVLLLIGGLGVASYAAFRAFQKNTGGIATTWKDVIRQIKLGWEGVVALIKGDEFSDELTKNLEKAENKGVMRFLKGFEVFLGRMKVFWEGLKTGFEEGVDALADSSAMKRLMDTMDSVFSLFTGNEVKDSKEALASWGEEGASTGKKLAQLGEKALDAIERIVKFGDRVMKFVKTLTDDDVSEAFKSTIKTFDDMWSSIKTTVEVVGWLAKAIKLLVNVFQTAGAFIGETFGAVLNFGKMNVGLFSKLFKGDVKGAAGELGKFLDTPVYEETRKQAGDAIRVFDPESRIGFEAEDKKKITKQLLQQRETARREATQELQKLKAKGEDTAAVVRLLEQLNQSIFEISKRPPPPLKVSIDSDQVASKTKEATQRDQDRNMDDFSMAFSL